MALTLSNFVKSDLICPLAWLGRHKWLKCRRVGERFSLSTDKDVIDKLPNDQRRTRPPEFWGEIRKLLYSPYANDKDLLMTYALSRAACGGPKVFRPTNLQCQSLEQTSPDLPWSDYCQDYETLFVEFPDDYIAHKLRQGLKRCPKYVVVWYDPEVKAIVVNCQFGSLNDRIVSLLAEKPGAETIEQMLSQDLYYEMDGSQAQDDGDFNAAVDFERLAINLNLLMAYPQKNDPPVIVKHADRRQLEEIQRLKGRAKHMTGSKRTREEQRLELARANLMAEIQFEREIDWYHVEDRRVKGEPGDGEGLNPEPHWRKGHWRNQPYGPRANPEYKRIRIAPVYVIGRAYRDAGLDVGEAKTRTITTYVQKGDEAIPEMPPPEDTPMKEAV